MEQVKNPVGNDTFQLEDKLQEFRKMCSQKEVEELTRICDWFTMSITHDQQLLAIAAGILNDKTKPDVSLQDGSGF